VAMMILLPQAQNRSLLTGSVISPPSSDKVRTTLSSKLSTAKAQHWCSCSRDQSLRQNMRMRNRFLSSFQEEIKKYIQYVEGLSLRKNDFKDVFFE
jgi:hypothetical protein